MPGQRLPHVDPDGADGDDDGHPDTPADRREPGSRVVAPRRGEVPSLGRAERPCTSHDLRVRTHPDADMKDRQLRIRIV
jgi:hypothetical protein